MGENPEDANLISVPLTKQEYPPPQAYPPQAYPPQGYQPQGYPPQGFQQTPQQGYPPPYSQQGFPQQPPPQGYSQQYQQGLNLQPPPQVYPPSEAIFVPTTDQSHLFHDDSPAFVHTSESFTEQVKKLPAFMLTAATTPRTPAFETLKAHSSWLMVWSILFVKTVIALILSIIAFEINNKESHDGLAGSLAFEACFTLFVGPIIYLAINGAFTAFAKCMSSRPELSLQPTFLQFCYVTLLFGFPLSIISNILTWIPVVGIWFSFLILIWQIVLWVISMQAVFHVTACQAIGIVILFSVLIVVVMVIVLVTAGSALVVVFMGR